MIGRSIGNYKIVRVLGEGGMGTVYLAEHPMIGKRVAVKMLRPDLGTDPGLVSRFFQEAKAVNEIRHPNIVDISDFGHTSDGTVYFVMELMEGQSLRDRLAGQGPMPLEHVLAVGRQVIDALAAAHRVGIVHRDLKPDNIFLVSDAQVPGGFRAKLFDFGVAKLLGDKQQKVGHKTIDGAVVGTPFYMSPEQALCQDVGTSADIYAMGVVLYEMLTGTVPFHAEQLVILLNAILKQPAPPPSRIRTETPPWLDRLVLRCLEKDAEARPASMDEVNATLAAGMAESAAAGPADNVALRATMMASASTVIGSPGPSSAPAGAARGSDIHQATIASGAAVRHTMAPLKSQEAGESSRVPSARGGVARAVGPDGRLQRLRAYLDSRRVQRVAIPLIIVASGIIVLSIFLSSAAKRPITDLAPEIASAPADKSSHTAIHLNSDPQGAEVLRLTDNRQLGTTPLVDIRQADGRQINYRFHLAGYTDVQMPFQASAPGRFEITATLSPVERRPDGNVRPWQSTGRRNGHGKDRQRSVEARPATQSSVPETAPGEVKSASGVSASATRPGQSAGQSALPPLGERNPVHRIGH